MKFAGKKRKIVIGVVVFIIATALILGWWEISAYNPSPEALKYLEGGERVKVERNRWIVFEPETDPGKGFILYPGGHVEPESYAPLAYRICEEGYRVVIVPMPLDLAVFGSGKASKVVDIYKNIDKWVLGGHSLGGSMAARFADENPAAVDGLVLLAAYPAKGDNLADDYLRVLSIYGNRDNVLDKDKVMGRRNLLPSETELVVIEGGNHAQFGNYGEQRGDGIATISREDQQRLTVEKIVDLLERL